MTTGTPGWTGTFDGGLDYHPCCLAPGIRSPFPRRFDVVGAKKVSQGYSLQAARSLQTDHGLPALVPRLLVGALLVRASRRLARRSVQGEGGERRANRGGEKVRRSGNDGAAPPGGCVTAPPSAPLPQYAITDVDSRVRRIRDAAPLPARPPWEILLCNRPPGDLPCGKVTTAGGEPFGTASPTHDYRQARRLLRPTLQEK